MVFNMRMRLSHDPDHRCREIAVGVKVDLRANAQFYARAALPRAEFPDVVGADLQKHGLRCSTGRHGFPHDNDQAESRCELDPAVQLLDAGGDLHGRAPDRLEIAPRQRDRFGAARCTECNSQ
jgi:hypothetical protein